MKRVVPWMSTFVVLLFSPLAAAQGIQTGMLVGHIGSAEGLSLPDAEVRLTSSSLQGERTATTDRHGSYRVRGLPPGTYQARIEHPAMAPAAATVLIQLGGTAKLNVTMAPGNVEEPVMVVTGSPSPVVTPQTDFHLTADEVDALPAERSPFIIASLAPGLSFYTPDAGQLTISGGFAYDNVFLIDGVDVTDNLFGRPDDLFIADAIAETQVVTSGISAEYGRFSGGVVNIITQSGGDRFSGSLSARFRNPAWTNETPFEEERGITRDDTLFTTHEGTFGGPLVKNRLWFFTAGHYFEHSMADSLGVTLTPVRRRTEERRVQAKLTASPAPSHRLQVNIVTRGNDVAGPTFTSSIDPATVVPTRSLSRFFVASYKGAVTPALFAELQYSEKRQGTRRGNPSTDIVDSPFFTKFPLPVGLHYNGPAVDGIQRSRDNRQLAGNASYAWTSPRFGSHDTTVGLEHFVATLNGGSGGFIPISGVGKFGSTGFSFYTAYKTDVSDQPALDANGNFIPVFRPGNSALAQFFLTGDERADITTQSLYITDRWALGTHWRLNLGLRYERARRESNSVPFDPRSGRFGIDNVDASRLVPRLGAAYDPLGDGQYVVSTSYSHYSGKYAERLFGYTDPAEHPGSIAALYVGPPGEGRDFAPGFDTANYWPVAGNFRSDLRSYDDEIRSPMTREFTASAAATLGTSGYVRVGYTRRSVSDLVESFVTLDNGTTTVFRSQGDLGPPFHLLCPRCGFSALPAPGGVNFGTFDALVLRNSDEPQRDFQALQMLGRYRLSDRWLLNVHWTVQLQNEGDFDGELRGHPGVPSCFGVYPEILVPSRACPRGDLWGFQRHRVLLWSSYDLNLGRFGQTSVTALYLYDSGHSYSLGAVVPVSSVQLARDPGYARPPQTTVAFLGNRGTERYNDPYSVDLDVTSLLS